MYIKFKNTKNLIVFLICISVFQGLIALPDSCFAADVPGSIDKMPSPEPVQVPAFEFFKPNSKLPDPFMFKAGSQGGRRATSISLWTSRNAEISALAQTFEYGIKPLKPQSITSSFKNNSLTITCSQNGKAISFTCPIQYPVTGKAPYPAMIGVNKNSLNTSEILKLGVALITFPADQIAEAVNPSSRGKGKFFELYGSDYDAGALIAWAWGADCLIDALEMTPGAEIDPKRLGVTGGSRDGKGALAIGAFDKRIVLTIPQESGNEGASAWRLCDAQQATGQNIQTLSGTIAENVWFAKEFNKFGGQTDKLPFDQHEIFALCAPRGLLVIDNPDFDPLGNLCSYYTSAAGHTAYEALGVPDNMGYSSVGGHGHCLFPDSQLPELKTFIQKFLLGQEVSTKVFRSDKSFTFDKTKWVDWTVPALK